MDKILWLIGLIFIGFGFYGLWIGNPEDNKKQLWLLKHFGKQGRQNWLINDYLITCLGRYQSAQIKWFADGKSTSGGYYVDYMRWLKVYNNCKQTYGEGCFELLHRLPDGTLSGLVWTTSQVEYWTNNINAPWSPIFGTSRTDPKGADWIAAGYQYPISCNGVRINPVTLFLQEGGEIKS
jgi:hypothetical protein